MRDKGFYTKANRSTYVVRTSVTELPKDSFRRPRPEDLSHPSDAEVRHAVLNGDPIWRLSVYYRTGFDKEQSFGELYASKKKVLDAEARYAVGSLIDPLGFIQPSSQFFDAGNLSTATELSLLGRGEPPYELINEVLVGAGVRKDWLHLSESVMSWLGQSGKSALEARFGENWEAVASLEYCVKHFPPSSLASLAARTQVADYLARYNYDCGYAARELEMLYGGAEEVAIKSKQTRHLAGEGGGAASRKRKRDNLEVLMTEIEKLAGAVDLFSEDRILAQAFDAAREREPRMPKSKKTLNEYGTALRSEEPFKSRYDAVFRRNA